MHIALSFQVLNSINPYDQLAISVALFNISGEDDPPEPMGEIRALLLLAGRDPFCDSAVMNRHRNHSIVYRVPQSMNPEYAARLVRPTISAMKP